MFGIISTLVIVQAFIEVYLVSTELVVIHLMHCDTYNLYLFFTPNKLYAKLKKRAKTNLSN